MMSAIDRIDLLEEIANSAQNPAAFPGYYEPIEISNGVVKLRASEWRQMMSECEQLRALLKKLEGK